jgi:hypothetical protein
MRGCCQGALRLLQNEGNDTLIGLVFWPGFRVVAEMLLLLPLNMRECGVISSMRHPVLVSLVED